jgi:hypothetical protein
MKRQLLSRYSIYLVLLIIITGLLSVMPSCGGGGGGGGGGGPITPPYIYAGLISLPTGSSLPGYGSAWVEVLDDITGYPITNAIVTMNGVALVYEPTEEDYEGDVIVAPGGRVDLSVTVGGTTYTASVTQLGSFPTIIEPANGASWIAGLPNTIKWSGSYPTINTSLLLGILADDLNGELLWPSNGYLLELASSETSYTIPAYSLNSCSGFIILAIDMEVPISSAAPDSFFVIGGLNYAPITVTAPTPTILSSGGYASHYELDIAVDSTNVYWTEIAAGIGSVKKVGINGGAVTNLVAPSIFVIPTAIAIDSTSVYWTEYPAGNVMKVGINGGAVTFLVSGLFTPGAVTVDSTSVYWTDPNAGNIEKVGINGGAVTTLASGLSGPHRIAVDSTSIYWTEYSAGNVKKIGLNGGAVTTLASGLTYPHEIAIDSTSVYWTENITNSGAVKKVGLNGGAVTTLASGLSTFDSIAVDSTSVYWSATNGSIHTINKVGVNGGTVTPIVRMNRMSTSLIVDSSSVYWGDDDGYVNKISK